MGRKNIRSVNRVSLIGQRFGKVVVLSDAGNEFVGVDKKTGYKKYKSLSRYKCDCGNEGTTRSATLTSGRLISCGCDSIERCKKNGFNKRRHVHSGFSFLINSYKGGAKKRGLEFSLTRDEFKNLTSSDCFYCGEKPSKIRKTRFLKYANAKGVYGYRHNGIDRVDNNSGYTTSNCVPCCEACNKMKMDKTVDVFLEKIKLIYEKHLSSNSS